MRTTLFTSLLILTSTVALASPGELPTHIASAPGDDDTGGVTLLLDGPAAPSAPGTFAFLADAGTRAMPARIVTFGEMPFDAPSFTRTKRSVDAPWIIDAGVRLSPSAKAGHAQVMLFDLTDDANAQSERRAMQIFPLDLSSAERAELRIELLPDDGFVPGHRYRVAVVQRLSGEYVTVAQSTFVLN